MTTQIKSIAKRLLSNSGGEITESKPFDHTKTCSLAQYIERITGETIDLNITIEDFKTVMVSCSMTDIFEIVKSWCNYYNSRQNERYIMLCKLVGAYDIKITIEERGTIGKNLCYEKNGAELHKLSIRQVDSDGSYHRKTVGYIVEHRDKFGNMGTELFDSKEKHRAKKYYKLLQRRSKDRS